MATERPKFVNAAADGTGDGSTNNLVGIFSAFQSCSAGEAAEQIVGSNLVALDEFITFTCEGATDDTVALLVDGFTTDATRYVKYIGNNTSGVWDASKFTLSIDAANPVWLNDPYVILSQMQVESSKASPASLDCAVFAAQTGCIIDRCLLRGGRWALKSGTTGTLTVMRTAAVNSSAASGGGGMIDSAAGTIEIQDSIFIGDTYGVRQFTGSTYTERNCYAKGNAGFAFSGTHSLTTCASSDTTGSAGLQSIAYDATTFANVTPGSEDFTIVTGSPLVDTATNNSGQSAPFNYTVDAAGVTITQPQDVGTIQLGAAPSPAITTIAPDPAITALALVITGTDFEAAQGTGAVTQEQGAVVVGLTESAWADLEITATSATIESTGLKYGVNTIKVTADAGGSGTNTFTATPLADNDYVDLTSVAVSGDRITAIADLEAGDQIRYEALLQLSGSPTIYTVTVLDDAQFSVDGSTPDGSYTFEVRAWDTNDQTWGTVADQTVIIGAAATGGIVKDVVKSIVKSVVKNIIK